MVRWIVVRAFAVMSTLAVVLAGPVAIAEGAVAVDGMRADRLAARVAPMMANGDPKELSKGAWGGARTNANGRRLLIVFVGGAPYDRDDPCTVKYRAVATESKRAVHVRIVGSSPPRPSASFECNHLGYGRQVIVRLASPFAGRELIAYGEEQPVFDGATLAQPSWLPDGWVPWSEGPGYPNPQSARNWTRLWGLLRPPPVNDRCTPSQSYLQLTQGLADRTQDSVSSGVLATTYEVNGVAATYWVKVYNANLEESTLTWRERGQRFVLTSSAGCVGDEPLPVDTMLRFARSLAVP
jgi:hypothetical protein